MLRKLRSAFGFGRRARILAGAGAVSMLLVVVPATTPAAQAFVPAPIVTLIPSLAGAAAGEGAVALGVAGTATTVGATGIAGIAAFGVGYYGTTALLNWAFDNPPTAGAQPINGDASYINVDGTTGSFGAGYAKMGRCLNGTLTGFGTGFSNNRAPNCFSAASVAAGGTANPSMAVSGWRCKVSSCSSAVSVMALQSNGRIATGAGTMGGFTSTYCVSGCSMSTTLTVSTGPAVGFDVYYDTTKIEWAPPTRQSLKTTTVCRNLSTGARITNTATSADFYGSESTGRDLGTQIQCPSGQVGVSLTIDLCGAGGAAPCSQVHSWTANTRVTEPTTTDPYKNCLPGGSNAPCRVKLYKMTDTGWKLCDESSACHTYDPQTEWAAQTWRCEWGSYVVPLTECAPLKTWTAGTVANVGTDPDPSPDPAGTPNPDPNPSPSPSTGTGTGTFPTTGPNPETTPPTDPQGDPDSASCFGSGWSWNPISWVYIPVKCSLLWAFQPSPGFVDGRVSTVRTTFEGTTPGQYVDSIGGLIPDLPGAGNCAGIPVHYDLSSRAGVPNVDFRLGAACEGDTLHTAAGIAKIVISACLVLGAAWTCVRAVAVGFGFQLVGKLDTASQGDPT